MAEPHKPAELASTTPEAEDEVVAARAPLSGRVRGIGFWTVTALVVANMVGTGVFTSIGYQAGPLPSAFPILMLWLVGGFAAFCGATAYAELAGAIPRSGGEYHFLSRIYHPALGSAAGFVSATVGFSAPIALAAIAFGSYFGEMAGWEFADGVKPDTTISVKMAALSIVLMVAAVHLISLGVGSAFQNLFTLLKLGLIGFLIFTGLFLVDHQPIALTPQPGDDALIWSSAFAISLVYVNYTYSGWNAGTYVVDEVRGGGKTVGRSLLTGTALVTIIYLLLNLVFLLAAPLDELAAAGERGAYVAASHMFGEGGARLIAIFICIGLVSTISAMMWTGPRVMQVMGEDLPILRPLGTRTERLIPIRAIFVQVVIVAILVLTGTFSSVLRYVECLLMFCASATVLGVIVLRIMEPGLKRPYRCWGYPVTPILFIILDVWALYHLARVHPTESLWGLLTFVLGIALYYVGKHPYFQKESPAAGAG